MPISGRETARRCAYLLPPMPMTTLGHMVTHAFLLKSYVKESKILLL